MVLRFLKSKIFLLFSTLFFVGFFIGYDYAVLTSKDAPPASPKAPAALYGKDLSPVGAVETAAENENSVENGD